MVGAMAAAAVSVPAFNVVVDPYEVFQTGWLRQGGETNERFLKVEHLLANRDAFDGLLMGSSTMGTFPIEAAQHARPDRRWYNAAYMGGMVHEATQTLKIIVNAGAPIREVVMGLDLWMFREPSRDRSEPSREAHPRVSGTSWSDFYARYLFASSAYHGALKIAQHLRPVPDIAFDVRGTGEYRLVKREQELLGSSSRPQPGTQPKARMPTQLSFVQARFEDLRELVDFTRRQGIQLHLFINPMPEQALAQVSADTMTHFRAKLTAITGTIPDYSQRQAFSRAVDFYDQRHLRPGLARRVLLDVLACEEACAARQVAHEKSMEAGTRTGGGV